MISNLSIFYVLAIHLENNHLETVEHTCITYILTLLDIFSILYRIHTESLN